MASIRPIGLIYFKCFSIKVIKDEKGAKSDIYIRIEYHSLDKMEKGYEVDSYFKVHKGCNVTLYQDAKVPQDVPHLNMVRGPHDSKPKLNSCWSDVYCSLVWG